MAKYCGNCGTQMEDVDRVCGNCGTPFDATTLKQNITIVNPEKENENRNKVKKILKLGVCLVSVILVLVIAINLITTFTGYNGLLRKVMVAYQDYDIDALVSMSSDMYYYGGENYAEIYFENAVGYTLDELESAVGHSYKLSYQVIETYKLSNRNFQSALKSVAWMYEDFDCSVIEQIVIARVDITATQGKRSADNEIEITMTKENGNWKVMYITNCY